MSAPDSPSIQDQILPSNPSPPPLALLPPPSSTTPDGATTESVGAAAATSTNPRRLPPPCWSHEETIALIDAYRDKWYSLRRSNLKATHWQEVAEEVAARCPSASPQKTAVQCRHKMEKLRKRYRTEIQRARSMPVSRFSSSWVHFKRMADMEKGSSTKTDYDSDSLDEDNDDEEDDYPDPDPYSGDGYKNGGVNAKTAQRFFNRSVIPGNNGSGDSSGGGCGGFRIRIPTGVSIAQPGPRFQGKIDQKYTTYTNSNMKPNINVNPKVRFGAGLNYGARVSRGSEEAGRSGIGGKRERSEDPMAEIAGAMKLLGDGYVRMEQMKMEMTREIEVMRMEMEMRRSEMILESQQRIVEAFAKALADKKKKSKRMSPSPES